MAACWAGRAKQTELKEVVVTKAWAGPCWEDILEEEAAGE